MTKTNEINISVQDFTNPINEFVSGRWDGNGTWYHKVGETENGDALCLVFGMQEGYDPGSAEYQKDGLTLCSKLAFNIDDLQCDYDVDWIMPWTAIGEWSGEVYDTDQAVVSDLSGVVEWYTDQAKAIIEGVNDGSLAFKDEGEA